MTSLAPDIRPLSIGQILDRGIRLYRNNFLSFLGIIALAQIPLAGLLVLLTGSPSTDPSGSPQLGAGSWILAMVTIVASTILTQMSTAAMTLAVSDNYLGNPISILGSYRKIGRSWWTLLGATILAGLLISVVALVGFLPFALIPYCGWVLALPATGAIVYFSMVVIPLIAPVVVLEKQPGSQALSRAWHLARNRFWWVLGFFVLLQIFSIFIVEGPVEVVNWLIRDFLAPQLSFTTQAVIEQSVTALLSILYLPLQMACVTLLYFDMRVRQEGFDLALMAADTSETKFDSNMAVFRASSPPGFNVTGTELGYFCLVTIGTLIFFVLAAIVLVLIGAAPSGF